MRTRLSWQIIQERQKTRVLFSGRLDEKSDLSSLSQLSGEVIFDLAGIDRVNSVGATRWIQLLATLDAVTGLTFERCSRAIVAQLNMVYDFRGAATVASFYAPYICPESGEERDMLLRPDDLDDDLTPPTLATEEGTLVLDDVPRRYFAFLRQVVAR